MMDDFAPKKPGGYARISLPETPPAEQNLDEEIGEAFASPEETAATEPDDNETIVIDNDEGTTAITADTKPAADKAKPSLFKRNKSTDSKPKVKWRWWPPKVWVKKQWLLVGGIILVLLAAAAAFFVFRKPAHKQQTTTPQKTVVKTPPKPVTVPSRLTGLPVSEEQSKLPVTGIMIENSDDARPQSGLDSAGVIYEAVAEGGITRFLALYEDNQPDYVGPVRSSRPYYLRWLLPFDASYAHVGGSPDALSDIKTLGVKDLDQFYNPGPYQRVNTRYAPHNVYTNVADLISLEKTKKFNVSNFTGFPRKAETPSKTPNATSIDFTISGPDYSAHYDYDPATNSYKRSEGGAPHMVVSKTGAQTQLQPKVVIALVMNQYQGELDASNAHYTQYDTVGTGQMYVFQDGTVTSGSWTKTDDKSQFTFTDSIGKPLPLNPGQTWISIVGLSGDVAYK